MDYFMILHDLQSDLKPGGFDDDHAIAQAVLRVVNGST
jgi:hypothetical protein